MGKKTTFLFLVVFMLLLAGCAPIRITQSSQEGEELVGEEKASFFYFWEQANLEKGTSGYGLIRDRYPGNPSIASIAATGFGLTAIPIGVERGWISREEGLKRAEGTLDTLLKMEHKHGFFYHFINIKTGEREWNSEISSIDTGILINGILTVGEYFGGAVEKKGRELYERVDWNWFVDPGKKQFYMSYTPEKGFAGHWDFYAEQLMLYVLAAGSPTHPIDPEVYLSFTRHKAQYKDSEPFIHSWFGSIFTYQYSHAWTDFRNLVDSQGVDWFHNSVIASQAAREFAIDSAEEYKGLGENAWGLTACDTPKGYNGQLGSPPSGYDNTAHQVDGTVAPAGALGSIVFTPEASLEALKYYLTIPGLSGKYGLKDAFNLDQQWVDTDYIGIDKGITLLMISNYRGEKVWKIFMEIPYVQKGLKQLQFVNR